MNFEGLFHLCESVSLVGQVFVNPEILIRTLEKEKNSSDELWQKPLSTNQYFQRKEGSETCNELWSQCLNQFITAFEAFDIQPEKKGSDDMKCISGQHSSFGKHMFCIYENKINRIHAIQKI